ncbi:CRISPR-associated helicase/endonuclease Cas3 [Actinokineospora auranticolor]|uniref:CRISPR-associated endonuclease/helicase Cas3 n=1 Tax=Actinokineospora auranticolor TaxID=155976 RepID=A0A2S6GEW1_9PSEU|nr:CRISPR-associated helicase/endonuclease Cas3 [Actinokineospora auranticolor]PPK63773.1 CRISPR-associated endonuclease/helicase Cas3 [Actinokineospora auranticolor]
MTGCPPVWVAWGKAGAGKCHPLVCHVLDTAAVAGAVLVHVLGPQARNELLATFAPLGDAEGWVALLCGLHDIGKYSPAFQAVNADLAGARFGAGAEKDLRRVAKQKGVARRDTPHGLVTAMAVRESLIEWGADFGTADYIAVALGGHHGYFPDAAAVRQARREVNNHGESTWRGWRDGLVRDVVRLRGLPHPETVPWRDVRVSPVAAVVLAAVTTISDWIASDVSNFPYNDTTDIQTYADSTGALAAKTVERLGLTAWRPPVTFAELFPGAPKPRPVQAVVEELTRAVDGPTMLLIEAPTGEGKTRAGLQAAAAMVRRLALSGIYVALPTKATSKQTWEEVAELAGPVPVQLAHSGAEEVLAELMTEPRGVGVDEPGDGDLAALEWFTRKRNLLTTIGVGTIDQALKGAIRSGHVFVRLAALTNKVVVIDEAHAYDTYMSTLLDRLLIWLGRLGVSVVVQSATLPAGRRRDLVAAWQAGLSRCLPAEVPPIPDGGDSPRVTRVDRVAVVSRGSGVSALNSGRTIKLKRVADDEVVDWALDRVADGGSAVVVHNLVRRVEQTCDALAERVKAMPAGERPELIVITGRLPAGARRVVEDELKAKFGADGTRPRAIVIGTQVLEQGLDLDFDAMLTDLAPIDWIIQRAGRLHRHAVRGVPELAVAGVEDTADGPRFPSYLGGVYEPMVMMRTWALLRERESLSLPGEVPALVDALYGDDDAVACPVGWEERWREAEARLVRARDRSKHSGRLMYLPLPHAVNHLSELTKNSKSTSRTRENGRKS